jgi:hypothetical protein
MKRRCLTVLLARVLWSQLFVKVEILWILHEGFDTKPECEKVRDEAQLAYPASEIMFDQPYHRP